MPDLEVIDEQLVHGWVGAEVDKIVLVIVDTDASVLDGNAHVFEGSLALLESQLGTLEGGGRRVSGLSATTQHRPM